MASAVPVSVAVLLLWGISDVLIALGARKAGVAAAVLGGNAVMMLLYAGASPFIGLPPLTMGIIPLVLLGGALSAAGILFYYKGMRQGVVSVVSPIVGCIPVVAVAITVLFLGERMSWLQVAGAGLAIAGVVLSSLRKGDVFSLNAASLERGALYGIITLACWGPYFALIDFLTPSLGWFYPIFLTKAVSLMIVAAYFALQDAEEGMAWGRIGAWAWLVVALIGVVEFAGHFLYGYGVGIGQTALVAPIAFAYPAFTILMAHLLFRERLEKSQYAGIVIALAGVVMVAL